MKKKLDRSQKQPVRPLPAGSLDLVTGGINPQPLPPGLQRGIVVGT